MKPYESTPESLAKLVQNHVELNKHLTGEELLAKLLGDRVLPGDASPHKVAQAMDHAVDQGLVRRYRVDRMEPFRYTSWSED